MNYDHCSGDRREVEFTTGLTSLTGFVTIPELLAEKMGNKWNVALQADSVRIINKLTKKIENDRR